MQIVEVITRQDKKGISGFSEKTCTKMILSGYASSIQLLNLFLILQEILHFSHGEAARWILKDDKGHNNRQDSCFYRQGKVSRK